MLRKRMDYNAAWLEGVVLGVEDILQASVTVMLQQAALPALLSSNP